MKNLDKCLKNNLNLWKCVEKNNFYENCKEIQEITYDCISKELENEIIDEKTIKKNLYKESEEFDQFLKNENNENTKFYKNCFHKIQTSDLCNNQMLSENYISFCSNNFRDLILCYGNTFNKNTNLFLKNWEFQPDPENFNQFFQKINSNQFFISKILD
jgi:hypothetical protein